MTNPRKRSRQIAQKRNRRRRAIAQQRSQAVRSRSAETVVTAGRRRVRWILVAATLVVALAVGVILVVRSDSSSGPSTSLVAALVQGADRPLTIGENPTAYTFTYRVDTYSSDDGSDAVSTQTFAVRRPFDANIVSKADAPPGGAQQWSVTASLDLAQNSSTDQAASAKPYVPTAPPGDYRFDASLDDLVADGTFVLGDRRTLLGRECQVYRTGSPLESYEVTVPTKTDYSDVCIDGSGLVLEELSVASGKVTFHQVATAVDPAATVGDDTFKITATPTSAADGGSELNEIDATTAPVADYWSFTQVPTGYTLQHRYVLRQSIADPEADTSDTTVTPTTIIVESYVDLYVDGINMIVVHQGPSSVEPGFDSALAKDVATTNLGTVKAASGVAGSIVSATATTPASWFVQVSGTIPRADLVADVGQLSNT
jgi:hypothetical protein